MRGASSTYQRKGDELYVRAVVTSTKPHPNPSFQDQRDQAWTQPVGWEKRYGQASEGISKIDVR